VAVVVVPEITFQVACPATTHVIGEHIGRRPDPVVLIDMRAHWSTLMWLDPFRVRAHR
jgi:hypothetical protein